MFEKLRALLENEKFPHIYYHKFVGSNTASFVKEAELLKEQFSHLKLTIALRESSHEKYLAYTFSFEAHRADEIMALIEATAQIQGIKIIL